MSEEILMVNFLYKTARLFWPELATFDENRQIIGTGNVIFFLYSSPLTLIALIWLIRVTDLSLLTTDGYGLIAIGILMLIFSRLNFFTIIEIHPGTYANSDSSLSGVAMWTGLLLFGPTVLWLGVLGKLIELVRNLGRSTSTSSRWVYLRVFTLYNAAVILPALLVIQVYQSIGFSVPILGGGTADILPAFVAILSHFLLFVAISSGFIVYVLWAQTQITVTSAVRPMLVFLLLALGLPYLAYPFGILAAGYYVQNSLPSFALFYFGLILVAILARQMSAVAESSRQQSRQLEQLERLSRSIISELPDSTGLSEILKKHVPPMFPSARILIWVQPDQFLLRNPPDWRPSIDNFWTWLTANRETRGFLAAENLPWRSDDSPHRPLLIAPILEVETSRLIGAIFIELQILGQPWSKTTLIRLYPAVNALSAQVASALQQAQVYLEALEHTKTTQELQFAGEIQASFLPDKIPFLRDWEISVTILPAREISGDFFDFLTLDDDKLGLLIADVTDKGVGPALYMALSRTLIRTYAMEYEFEPDTVFFATNRRILQDARANLFVTVFFGVLDQKTGVLTYSNAGHNPPYLVRKDGEVEVLGATGMPVGIETDAVWDIKHVDLQSGDALVLYTDGIPDAQNEDGEFFEQGTLLEIVRAHVGDTANEIQAGILNQVQNFIGTAAQFDDITLMVLTRNPEIKKEGEALLSGTSENQPGTHAPDD